jgi:hypothetical protein
MSSLMHLCSIADPMLHQHHALVLSFNHLHIHHRCHILHHIHTLHMDEEELKSHRDVLRLIQRDLQFVHAIEADLEDEDEDDK